jgi:parallel beta-helix repeat protein
MKPKKIVLVVTLILFSLNFINLYNINNNCKAAPITLYVGQGEQYSTISTAIENASSGYRIFVYNGTYYENLTIDKKIDLFGEDRSITIINGNGKDNVININANNINISHFTIKNGGKTNQDNIIQVNSDSSIITDNIISNGYNGIYLNNTDNHLIFDNIIISNNGEGIKLNQSDNNVNISYNTITLNNNGIYFYSSDGNKIYNNNVKENDANGIFLNKTCINNKIVENNASENEKSGIYLNDYSRQSTIANNKVYENKNSGIILENCSLNTIINDNKVIRNTNYGLMIIGSTNIIQSNSVSNNKKDGIFLTADDNNTISSNVLSYNNLAGIRLYNSTDNSIYNNEIYNNSAYGAYLDFFTLDNTVYNNYFHDNGVNAIDKSMDKNQWNIAQTSSTNIVGGPYRIGNYWDDFDEKSEGAVDANDDGIADSEYIIYASNKDNGPLLDVTSPIIGNISISPVIQSVGGYTNISVSVTDNLEIRNVYLIVNNPNGQTSNISITQNRTGSTYYCYKQFSPSGIYNCSISAVDCRNWGYSSISIFNITSGTAPTISDNSPTKGSPNSEFIFNATVVDDEDPASDLSVYVIWNHGNKSENQSMTNVAGDYFECNVTLDKSLDSLTYYYFALDEWGNTVTSGEKTVTISDTKPPRIKIERYGTSFDDIPNSHTFAATITDESEISSVYIEYWFDNSEVMISDMNLYPSIGENYYKKVIIPDGDPEKIYCVIYANDTSGNKNNTKNPFANSGGPYSSYILGEVEFNGTGSFDLDGTITNYSWDFGDGTSSSEINPIHVYLSDGTYKVVLTVTDNDGRKGVSITTTHISRMTPHKIPLSLLESINNTYDLNLKKQFYCFDEQGNGVLDTFYDPNKEIFVIHSGNVNINGNVLFLLSIGDDPIPEFFWNTTTDKIIPINYSKGIVDLEIDDENEQAIQTVIVEKASWIFIEVDDEYSYADLVVKTGNRTIDSEFIWRKNNNIYVFDDPSTEYQFIYQDIYAPVDTPSFTPVDGGIINEYNPTVTIKFNVPVKIKSAFFGSTHILDDIDTSDNIVFTYSPLPYLKNGTYTLELSVEALNGKSSITSSATYFYYAYEKAPEISFIEENWMWITLSFFIIIILTAFILQKFNIISLEDSIYIKEKKIIPFFKTIVVGPMSIKVDNNEISKAEFFIDGQLKETLIEPPYFWEWRENAYMKHTLETKVYDDEGNSASSGEKSFYIFNPMGR